MFISLWSGTDIDMIIFTSENTFSPTAFESRGTLEPYVVRGCLLTASTAQQPLLSSLLRNSNKSLSVATETCTESDAGENRAHFWFDALKLQLSRLLHSFLGVPSPLYSYTWPPLTVFICNHMFARFLSFLLSFHPVLMPSLSISKSLIRHKNEQWTVINVQQTNKFDEFDAKKKSFSVSLGGCAKGLTSGNFVQNDWKKKHECKILV